MNNTIYQKWHNSITLAEVGKVSLTVNQLCEDVA